MLESRMRNLISCLAQESQSNVIARIVLASLQTR